MQAADLLNSFIEKISGTKFPVVNHGEKPKTGDIIIRGLGSATPADRSMILTEDGFRLRSDKTSMVIQGGAGKGSLNGVVTLIEDYFGVRYYAAGASTWTKSKSLTIPS
jgi:hypothetical protein